MGRALQRSTTCAVFAEPATDRGFPALANLNEELAILRTFIARGDRLEKRADTSKRSLKAIIQECRWQKQTKEKAGYDAGLTGDRDIVEKAYDLYAPGFISDLTIAREGI